MASPTTSLLVSSEEICNGAKLRRLILDGGTPALRRVFDGFHPPSRLAAALNVERQTVETLLKQRVLTRTQRNQLYPTDGASVDSGAFDITLLIILLTNICGLRRLRKGWRDKPPSSDTSLEANIARLRYYRNLLFHPANGSAVSSQDFEVYWQEIADALVAFGEDRNAIDALKAEPGGINVLDKLEMCDFTAEIEYHASRGRFQDGTREWIFNEVEVWLDDRQTQHQVMAIKGDAGMGKTVVSAVICKKLQEAGRLSGSHFCQHNFPRYRNPKLALQSLAFQLSCNLRGYKEALVKRISRNFGDQLSSLDVNDLFALLFEEPLSSVADPGRNVLIVIDGLDESEDQGKNELVDVIANHFSRLPRWIRLLVTTRPEKKILDKMRGVKSLELRPDDERNHRDIEVYFERRICDRATPEETTRVIRELVQLSEGQMLHAYFLLELLEKSTSPQTPEQLRLTFPQGISAIYTTYFKRMEAKLEEELKSNCGRFLTNFLCALTATRDPLPKEFVTEILRQNINISENDRLNVQRKRDSVISCISSLLPIRDGNVHVFHKSVKEWLTDKSRHGSHAFTMLEKDGHRILGKICATELDKLRANNVHDAPFSDIQKYALRHGSHHMLDALDDFNQLEELVKKYVTDLELVYAKLCAKNTDVLKELLLVQEHRSYSALSEETVGKIESLQLPFKKHGSLLQDLPHVIFQNVLNEGGSNLFREVLQLLRAKHPEIPYMELLDKSDHKSPVKARFYCSDKVVCFDVSPDGEHMVCEGRDGTIHLWSLLTGEQKWQRVNSWESKKSYGDVPFGTAFRRIGRNGENGGQALSFYRSTVFHPNGQYILPGNMANVYNLSGQPTSLFPESKCRFTACAFSGDKNRMLTDCPTSRKEVVVWNTESGAEIKRFKWAEDINSFALSPDGNLIAISDSKGSLLWYNVESSILAPELVPTEISNKTCGLLHITTKRTLVCGSIGATHSDRRDIYKLRRNVFDSAFVANRQPDCTCNSKVWLWPWESVDSLGKLRSLCKVYHHFVSSEVMIGFCFLLPGDVAVVGSPTVNYLTMLSVAPNTDAGKIPRTVESTFAWDATQVYTIVTTNSQKDFSGAPCLATVSVRDVNSATDVRAEKSVQLSNARVNNGRLSSPVERGVLLQTKSDTLELWTYSLSECVQSKTMPSKVERLIPVSKELLGCVLQTSLSEEQHSLTLSVIDVCSMEVVFERVLDDRAQLKSVACSIQRDVVFCKEQEASDKRQLVLYKEEAEMFTWNRDDTIYKGDCNWRQPHCVFSPNGKVVVTWNTLNDGYGLHVLMAGTGRESHGHVFLESRYDIADCTFLNDGESVVCRRFNDSNVWMFNVASGLVLAVIDVGERPTSIGSSPNESLIAVGLRFSNVKLIRAQLPRQGGTCVRRTRGKSTNLVHNLAEFSVIEPLG